MGPANGVNQETATTDRPPLVLHAVAVTGDMHANHPLAKGLEQLLAIARVVAQISNDQRIAVITAVDFGQRTGARTAVETPLQLVEFLNAQHARRITRKAADDRGRAITTAAHIVGDEQRVKTGPKVWFEK